MAIYPDSIAHLYIMFNLSSCSYVNSYLDEKRDRPPLLVARGGGEEERERACLEAIAGRGWDMAKHLRQPCAGAGQAKKGG